MTNEEIIEEILVESYRLNISEKVFEKFIKYVMVMDRADAYKKAYNDTLIEIENNKNNEIF